MATVLVHRSKEREVGILVVNKEGTPFVPTPVISRSELDVPLKRARSTLRVRTGGPDSQPTIDYIGMAGVVQVVLISVVVVEVPIPYGKGRSTTTHFRSITQPHRSAV